MDFSESPDSVLAIYGTLAPGQANHHQISALKGTWHRGTVRGRFYASGWGAALGFPGLVVDPAGSVVPVQLFESDELPLHWARLDEFEGEGYRRVIVTVETEAGPRRAWLYALAEEPPASA